MNPINPKGLSGAAMIPVGATITAATWHVAGLYGPSEPYATEAAAIADGIQKRQVGTLTIDLRWTMKWDPASVDANGATSHASGVTQTVSRVTYDSIDHAREHLARLERVVSR